MNHEVKFNWTNFVNDVIEINRTILVSFEDDFQRANPEAFSKKLS